ncbi:MAG: hypothetical protein QOG66_2412, partial [Methylobacteriaceae bacterium]|nr:hypothetical protein [Methylobacteriaceae bacterium]
MLILFEAGGLHPGLASEFTSNGEASDRSASAKRLPLVELTLV